MSFSNLFLDNDFTIKCKNIECDSISSNCITNVNNVGLGEGEVFRDIINQELNLKKLKAGTNINIVNNNDNIEISSIDTGITQASNIGEGVGVYRNINPSNQINFKSLQAGNNISIAEDITGESVVFDVNNFVDNITSSGIGSSLINTRVNNEVFLKSISGGSNILIQETSNLLTLDASDLAKTDNVAISSPLNTQLLQYNEGSNKWQNANNYNYKGNYFFDNVNVNANFDNIYSGSNLTLNMPIPTLSDIGKRILITCANNSNVSVIFPTGCFLYNESDFISISNYGSLELIVSSATQFQVISAVGAWLNKTSKPLSPITLSGQRDVLINTPMIHDALHYDGFNWVNTQPELCNPLGELYYVNLSGLSVPLTLQNTYYAVSTPTTLITNNSNFIDNNWDSPLDGQLRWINNNHLGNYYNLDCSGSFRMSSTNQDLIVAVFKNGVIVTGSEFLIKTESTNTTYLSSFHKVVQVTNNNDVFDIRVQNTSDANRNLIIYNFNLVLLCCCAWH
jgi:hypothetical protein